MGRMELGGAFASSPCPGCDEVLASSSSWLLRFPLAGWGFVYFALLACLLSIRTAWSNRAAMLLAAIGSGVSLVLSAALLATAPPLCTLCLLVHACNLAVFAALYVLVRSEPLPNGPKRVSFPRLQSAMVIAAVLLGGAIQAAMLKPLDDVRKASDEYRAAHPFQIPILRDDATLGSSSAPVRLVVFSSFQCPACRTFAGVAHRLNQQFPNAMQIIFKNYPLGKQCNPDLVREMQPRACAAAFAAEAANRQGEFWQYHDGIFLHSSLLGTEPELQRIARTSGLDMPRWESDRRSPLIETRVKEDIGLGHLLGINGTPAIFLDGRRVPATSLPILETLIKREIDEAQSRSQISQR
jgi:protein-disulfide isomerase